MQYHPKLLTRIGPAHALARVYPLRSSHLFLHLALRNGKKPFRTDIGLRPGTHSGQSQRCKSQGSDRSRRTGTSKMFFRAKSEFSSPQPINAKTSSAPANTDYEQLLAGLKESREHLRVLQVSGEQQNVDVAKAFYRMDSAAAAIC